MATIMRNGFVNGVKATIDPSIIPEQSVWKSLNVQSDISGILRIREGSEQILNEQLPSGKPQGAISAFDEIQLFLNNNIYSVATDTGAVNQIPGSIGATNPAEEFSLLKWTNSGQEVVYIFTGDGIYQTDHTTISKVEPYVPASGEDANMLGNEVGPGKARMATLRASLSQRVAVSGIKESPNTVYLSAPLDISYFPVSQVLQLPDDGDEITGITNWYNTLLIFRHNDIWALFGNDLTDSSAALVLQDGSVGCSSPDTITHVPNLGVCFVGPDNIYAVQGLSGVENKSRAIPIGDDIANYVKEAIEQSASSATGIYYDGEYRVCFPDMEQDERVFRLNTQQTVGWMIDSGPLTREYIKHDYKLYGLENYAAIHRITKDYLYDEGPIYNGERTIAPIPYTVTFRRENLQPGPARIKRIFLYVVALGRNSKSEISHFGPVFNNTVFSSAEEDNQDINIRLGTEQDFDLSIIVDGNEFKIDNVKVSAKRMDHNYLSTSEPVRIYEARIRPSIKGHYAQLKVKASQPGQLIALLGYGIDYQPKGRIRGIRNGVTNNKDW